MTRRTAALAAPLLILGAVLAPILLSRYWLFLVTSLLAYVIALIGLKVLFGDAGQLSLGQAAFIGIGAYTAGIISVNWKLTLPYELLAVMVVCAAIAGVIAVPALRVSGLRFALLTLAFAELFQWFLREAKGITGGEQGLYVPPLLMGPIDGKSQTTIFLLALGLATIASVLALHLPSTKVGRAMAAIRESRLAAESVGVQCVENEAVRIHLRGRCGGGCGDADRALLRIALANLIRPVRFRLSARRHHPGRLALGSGGMDRSGLPRHRPGALHSVRAGQRLRRSVGRRSPGRDHGLPVGNRGCPEARRQSCCCGEIDGRRGGGGMSVLTVSDVSVRFGALKALKGVSLTAEGPSTNRVSSARTGRARRPCSTRSPASCR